LSGHGPLKVLPLLGLVVPKFALIVTPQLGRTHGFETALERIQDVLL
jgi:hypothetical protein